MTNTQIEAKTAFLENQQAEMLRQYENAPDTERKAIINQVNSLMPVLSGEHKTFWLDFRNKLANKRSL